MRVRNLNKRMREDALTIAHAIRVNSGRQQELFSSQTTTVCLGAKVPTDPEQAGAYIAELLGADGFVTRLREAEIRFDGLRIISADISNLVYHGVRGKKSHFIILKRQQQASARLNFTLAHELGHYVRACARIEADGVDPEVWANQFAAAILMPDESVSRYASR